MFFACVLAFYGLGGLLGIYGINEIAVWLLFGASLIEILSEA